MSVEGGGGGLMLDLTFVLEEMLFIDAPLSYAILICMETLRTMK